MTPDELADELGISPKTLRAWLRTTYPRPSSEKNTAWYITADQQAAARMRFGARSSTPSVQSAAAPGRPPARTRETSDGAYVIDICDDVLGSTALRQH